MKGIEPSCPAWEAGVLPLNYTRGRIDDFRVSIADLQRRTIIARKLRRRRQLQFSCHQYRQRHRFLVTTQ